jgi:hypothetical protein
MLLKAVLMFGSAILLIVVMCLVVKFVPSAVIPDAVVKTMNTLLPMDKQHPFTKDIVLAFVAGGIGIATVMLFSIVLMAFGVNTNISS